MAEDEIPVDNLDRRYLIIFAIVILGVGILSALLPPGERRPLLAIVAGVMLAVLLLLNRALRGRWRG
jgi:hypothetical protein